jgi:hypothetical protein
LLFSSKPFQGLSDSPFSEPNKKFIKTTITHEFGHIGMTNLGTTQKQSEDAEHPKHCIEKNFDVLMYWSSGENGRRE